MHTHNVCALYVLLVDKPDTLTHLFSRMTVYESSFTNPTPIVALRR